MQELKRSHDLRRKKVEVDLPDALEALRGAFGSGSGKKPSPGKSGITEKDVLDKLDFQIRLQVVFLSFTD